MSRVMRVDGGHLVSLSIGFPVLGFWGSKRKVELTGVGAQLLHRSGGGKGRVIQCCFSGSPSVSDYFWHYFGHFSVDPPSGEYGDQECEGKDDI